MRSLQRAQRILPKLARRRRAWRSRLTVLSVRLAPSRQDRDDIARHLVHVARDVLATAHAQQIQHHDDAADVRLLDDGLGCDRVREVPHVVGAFGLVDLHVQIEHIRTREPRIRQRRNHVRQVHQHRLVPQHSRDDDALPFRLADHGRKDAGLADGIMAALVGESGRQRKNLRFSAPRCSPLRKVLNFRSFPPRLTPMVTGSR